MSSYLLVYLIAYVLTCRSNEWMAGEINHAIYLNTMCEAKGAVFPSRNQNQALTCDRAKWPWPMANETGPRPKHGSLYFFDYTDEQIEAMDLPAWHKPMIVAMVGMRVTLVRAAVDSGGLPNLLHARCVCAEPLWRVCR